MIAEMKVTKQQNHESKKETLLMNIDMVLLLTDFEIAKMLCRKSCYSEPYDINTARYNFISDLAMQPKICDRTIKNMLKWLRKPETRNSISDAEYGTKMFNFKGLYSDEIYSNAEPTNFTKGIPVMYTQSTLEAIYVIADHRPKVRKNQMDALVRILGQYAYRLKIVIPDDEKESIIDIAKSMPQVTSIYHDDISIIHDAKESGLDMTNLCFAISDLSYNYQLAQLDDESDPIAVLKVDVDEISAESGTGVGMISLKTFDDRDKYFALG